MRSLVFILTLLLTGCALAPRQPAVPADTLTLDLLDTGRQPYQLTIAVDAPPALRRYLHWQVTTGVYNQIMIDRLIPGSVAYVSRPQFSSRHPVTASLAEVSPLERQALRSVRRGEVGLVVNPDGSLGPALAIAIGATPLSAAVPGTLKIGSISAGGRAFRSHARKGDTLVAATYLVAPPVAGQATPAAASFPGP